MFWTPDNVQKVTGGRWLKRPRENEFPSPVTGVETDGRHCGQGYVYVARRGEKLDGHDFLSQALGSGAQVLVVDDELKGKEFARGSASVLRVKDSTTALGALAAAYRRSLRAKVIAVTGSVGKTTTKLLIDAVLRTRLRGKVSPKSYNNIVGVPLTIFLAEPKDDYLVVEIGTNAPGEIAALGKIAQPDIAVITHVGSAHLEGLGGIGGVLREKASLLSHLREGGVAIVNGDVEGLETYRRVAKLWVTFGHGEKCDLRMTSFEGGGEGVSFTVNGRWKLRVPLLGEHNAMNALAAAAVGRHMNVPEKLIAQGLASASGPAMRLAVERYGQGPQAIVVLNDCYNANPESMAAALRVLRSFPTAGRRVAVLGDMAELGDKSPDLHRELGERVVESGADLAILIGKLSMFTAETISRHWSGERVHAILGWDDSVPEKVASLLEGGDTVLVKASRAAGFERLVAAIGGRFTTAGGPAR